VDSGRVAQTKAASKIFDAAFFGKLDQNHIMLPLLAEVRQFFMDNPTWE
jgi:hypothetical protein